MKYLIFLLALILGFFAGCIFLKLIQNIINNKNKKEQVNHPAHYQKNGKECIEVMEEEFGPKAVYWFCMLNSFKYCWRAGEKDGNSTEQDLAKAKWYTNYADKLNHKHNNALSD